MPETTSIESYEQALCEGLIGQRQFGVLQFIAEHDCEPGVSQGDVSRRFNDASSSYQPRFRELEDCGAIYQSGVKVDPVTGRTVKCYRVTGTMPTRQANRPRLTLRQALIRLLRRFGQNVPDDAEITLTWRAPSAPKIRIAA